jgi:hypothetical protein
VEGVANGGNGAQTRYNNALPFQSSHDIRFQC